MAGTRKFNGPAKTDVKLTLLLAPDLDRQLRMLAARRGQPIGPMIRAWIIKELCGAPELADPLAYRKMIEADAAFDRAIAAGQKPSR